ncbi:MAG TPA: hypothetical protein V6D10_10390 [Trichocoleus sp.]|jgi:hypothetical protein
MTDQLVPHQAEVIQNNGLDHIDEQTIIMEAQSFKDFQKAVHDFQEKRIRRLRRVNQGWNIGLTAAGITCTLLTTVLGVVDVNNDIVQGWIKVGTGTLGAVAVAAQSVANQFRLKGKAGDYTLIEAEATVLAYKVQDIKTETELQELQNDFYKLIREAAQAEAKTEDRI